MCHSKKVFSKRVCVYGMLNSFDTCHFERAYMYASYTADVHQKLRIMCKYAISGNR